ncbi:MAG: serine/threonine-protein kinase [Myxococcales bacterium]
MNIHLKELGGLVAQGGFGQIRLARAKDARLSGHVVYAVKLLLPEFADEEQFVKMFKDEARVATLLHHPGIVTTLGTGEHDGTLFLVMEFLEGQSLQNVLAVLKQTEVGLNFQVAAWIAARIAEALDYVHHKACNERGERLSVVHRDVSPSNIFLEHRGTVKLIDFGIAKTTLADRISRTRTGDFKGKFGYMAPEQTTVEGLRNVDARVDIFLLGIVLWEMLVGKRLFEAENVSQILQAVSACRVPPPSTMTACAAELDRIVMRALAKDLSLRYQIADEMRADLDAFVGGKVAPRHIAQLLATTFPDSADSHKQFHVGGMGLHAPESALRPTAEQIAARVRTPFWTPSQILVIDSDLLRRRGKIAS